MQELRGWTLRELITYHTAIPVFFLLSSWVVFRIIGPQAGTNFGVRSGSGSYLDFVVLGFAFSTLVLTTVFGGSRAIRREQLQGTAELVLSTTADETAWILGKVAAGQVYGLVSFAIVLALGVLFFGFRIATSTSLALVALGMVLTLVSMTALGMILAGIAFFLKDDDNLALVLWPTILFLGGFAYPVSALPSFLQPISWSLPITYGLDITRRALLLGNGFSDVLIITELEKLTFLSALLLPLGYILFRRFVTLSRKGA